MANEEGIMRFQTAVVSEYARTRGLEGCHESGGQEDKKVLEICE